MWWKNKQNKRMNMLLSSFRKLNGNVHVMFARVSCMLALLFHMGTDGPLDEWSLPWYACLFFFYAFLVLRDVTYTQFCIIIDVKHQNLLSIATIVSNHHYNFSQSRGDYSTMFVVLIEKSWLYRASSMIRIIGPPPRQRCIVEPCDYTVHSEENIEKKSYISLN